MDIVERGTPEDNAQLMGKHVQDARKLATSRQYARAERPREVNDREQIENQDEAEEDIKMASIDSTQFNKNHCVLTANIKTAAGHNKIVVVYKIDTGSDSNIMPFHLYKKLFPNINKRTVG